MPIECLLRRIGIGRTILTMTTKMTQRSNQLTIWTRRAIRNRMVLESQRPSPTAARCSMTLGDPKVMNVNRLLRRTKKEIRLILDTY